jgi:hypothetical protein
MQRWRYFFDSQGGSNERQQHSLRPVAFPPPMPSQAARSRVMAPVVAIFSMLCTKQ